MIEKYMTIMCDKASSKNAKNVNKLKKGKSYEI